MARPISFEDAKRRYVHRFTAEHVPSWSRMARPDSTYHAPQYATDAEWYANTAFPGEGGISPRACHCHSSGQTWPHGRTLAEPFDRRRL